MKLNLDRIVIGGMAALTLCLTSTVVAYAQERATDVGPVSLVTPRKADSPAWGTSSTAVLTVPAFAFNSVDGSAISHTGPYNRYHASGVELEGPVFLPAGAVISEIELEGCDSDAASQVVFALISINSTGSYSFVSSLGSTGTVPTPGCGVFPLAVPPHTVDNANTYNVVVATGTTTATSVTAVRVRYTLQVSPAPGVASFTDVPTSYWAFQYIEALKASGITQGVTPTTYEPESNVTRAQMAVFLAKALGLYWPN